MQHKLNFLAEERQRLDLKQKEVFEKIAVSKGTYIRWESGLDIPSGKLRALSDLGFDVQYVVTGERSGDIKTLSNIPYQGVISEIVQTLEELLDEYEIDLPAASKGRIVEALFDHCITNKQKPNKSTIVPFLKAAGF